MNRVHTCWALAKLALLGRQPLIIVPIEIFHVLLIIVTGKVHLTVI